jgi:dipeptidyl aminopeptidase/acylaminoacyl peptidase
MWPSFLPDGKHYVYLGGIAGSNTPKIKVGSLDSDDTVTLGEAQSRIAYAGPGFLLYVRDGTLLAHPFDADTLRLSSEAISIAERVSYFKPTYYAPISASETGVLAYQDGSTLSRLVWFNRDGRELAQVGAPAAYNAIRISPDGQRAAVAVADSRGGAHDLWIFELNSDITTRFTYDPSSEFTPVWSPDGKQIVFSADRSAPPFLQIKALDDRGAGEGLLEPRGVQVPDDWSSEKNLLLYEQTLGQNNSDIWLLSMADRKTRPFLSTPFNETDARFSPNGNWVAYVSDDSGKPEVYVQAANSSGERVRISSSGGTQPHWRRDGKELFYLSPQQKLIAVPIKTGDRIQLGSAEELFRVDVAMGSSIYDVSADGKRFLVNARVSGPESTPITIVTNWTASLKKQ